MKTKYRRYSVSDMVSLGYSPHFANCTAMRSTAQDSSKSEIFAYGNFKSIIKILFSDIDSRPGLDGTLTSSTSPEVVNFVNNFLMREIRCQPPLRSDDDAFNSIIPRSVQTESELRPYLDNLKQFISEARSNLSSSDSSAPIDSSE